MSQVRPSAGSDAYLETIIGDHTTDSLRDPFLQDSDASNGLGEEEDVRLVTPSDSTLPKPRRPDDEEASPERTRLLIISFFAMVVVGLFNRIFGILSNGTMGNYPLFTNFLTTFVYLPTSFAYIIPMIKYGKAITKEAQEVPKRKFFIMGTLDSFAGLMQTVSTTWLSVGHHGGLIFLLLQASIPVSMIISYYLLAARYKWSQYIGALLVLMGLVLALIPVLREPSEADPHPVWISALLLIFSSVPQCLSSVYKEKALGETELDAVYLNGWVAVFQFITSFPLLLVAPAIGVPFPELPKNLWDGMRCLAGSNSITDKAKSSENDHCALAKLYIPLYIVFNLGYNVLIVLILKFGSSNILWLAMTVVVPLGSIAFSLNFMPNSKPLNAFVILGLLIILTGLVIYRFWAKIEKRYRKWLEQRHAPVGAYVTPDSPFFFKAPGHSPKEEGAQTPVLQSHAHVMRSRREEERALFGRDDDYPEYTQSSRAAPT